MDLRIHESRRPMKRAMRHLISPRGSEMRWLVSSTFVMASVVWCSGALFFSRATNGVYVGVCGQSTVSVKDTAWVSNSLPIACSDKLLIGIFCSTGAVRVLYPLDCDYFVKFGMRDAAGLSVTKTAVGDRWGSQFDRFPAKPGRSNRNRMAGLEVAGSHETDNPALSFGPVLPSPQDLFQMKRGGIYDLTLAVHLMKRRMLTNGWTWDPIMIPPFTVKVEKPPERKMN